jgi:transposase InsO family protein
VRFTERERSFVAEASVYRLLKARDLITSPACIVVKAADGFHTETTAPNQLWQTDFPDLKVTGWGWLYLSTVLDDFSRVRLGPRTGGGLKPHHRLEALHQYGSDGRHRHA